MRWLACLEERDRKFLQAFTHVDFPDKCDLEPKILLMLIQGNLTGLLAASVGPVVRSLPGDKRNCTQSAGMWVPPGLLL